MATKWEITKDELSKRITDSAIKLFGKNGYTNTKVTDIAKDAGTSSALVFKYFETKENLFLSLLKTDSIRNLSCEDDSECASDVLNAFINHVKKCQEEDNQVFKLWLAVTQSKDLPPSIFEYLKEDFEGSSLCKALEKLQDYKLIAEGNIWDIYMMLFISTYNIVARYKKNNMEMPPNEEILHIIQFKSCQSKYCKCEICGQVITVVKSTNKPIVCCGKEMKCCERGY